MKKRVLSLLMALVLCFSMLPTAALAEEAGTAQEIQDAADTGDIDNSGDVGGTDEGEDSGDVKTPEGEDGEDTGDNGDAETQDDTAQDTGNGKAPDAGVTDSEADTAVLTAQIAPTAEGETHTAHCVCGGAEDVNGHTHDATTTWTAADSLSGSAGNYYLMQSVSNNWTVTGEVKLCLNGQTITGSITVGSGAKLTLTDCTDNGKVQGEVTVNGGTLELYGGTITGGVQVGKHNDTASGSKFTMFGGVISGHDASSGSGGGVFLVGTTNQTNPPSFTMHGGIISNNTAGASDGGGGGVYVGEKCSFTMDGGTITGNTATGGNGGGIYIHYNAGNVSISDATITNNKTTATTTGYINVGLGGGIYAQKSLTVSNSTITGNEATYYGGGICGTGSITLNSTTVTGNKSTKGNGGGVYASKMDSTSEGTKQPLSVSGSTQIKDNAPNNYHVNEERQLPIKVTGTLEDNAAIYVAVIEKFKPGYGSSLVIAEPTGDGVTLSASNFKTDVGDCVTSLGEGGKVYLARCAHEMDESGYTCKKCHTEFDARVDESDYYQTLNEAFSEAKGGAVTLLRNVTLNEKCSAAFSSDRTLDLNGKAISSEDKRIGVGGGNSPNTLTVTDSGTNSGTQALNVRFAVYSGGTLAVDDSYAGDISRVELQAGGALERFGGKIGELVLRDAANGSTSTGYGLKLWKDNTNACTIGKITDSTKSQTITVSDLLGTDYAKCELYGKKGDGTWSSIDKSTKIDNLTDYTAYKVQFPECVHACSDDTVENPVCSVCGKELIVKIIATASDGTTKMAWFPVDSAIENGDGYVEAIQTLNSWSTEGCTNATLIPLCDVHNGTGGIGIASVTLTGRLTVDGGAHRIYSTTVAADADVTFKTGQYYYITVNGKASFVGGTYLSSVTVSSGAEAVFSGGTYQYLKIKDGGTAVVKDSAAFQEDAEVIKGALRVEGGSFAAAVLVNADGTMNVIGGSFTGTGLDKVTYDNGAKGTISGGSFAELYIYKSGTAWLAGGSFTKLSTSSLDKLSSLLVEGAAYYKGDNVVSNDAVKSLDNVTVVLHKHAVNDGEDAVTWTPIGSEAALRAITAVTEDSCYYYLTQDITLNDSSWAPVDGMVLDLNGKSITAKGAFDTITVNSGVDFTLTDCKGGGENYGAITHEVDPSTSPQNSKYNGRGVMVSKGGAFTMYGGCIGSNLLKDAGAGVYVAEGATFAMLGGMVSGNAVSAEVRNNGGGIWTAGTTTIGGDAKITGNRAQAGGGVYVAGGTLTLQGNAAVTENSSTNGYNSGIFVGLAGQLRVSGSVQVTGNTNGNTGGNVYLEPDIDKSIKTPIRVVDELTGASIHVTFLNDTLETIDDSHPMTIAEADTEGWIKDGSFVLDGKDTHTLYIDGTTVKLGTHPHEWEYSKQETDNSIRATCRVCQQYCCVSLPDGSYVYDGNAKGPVADYTGTWTADEVNVVYRQGNTVLPGRPTAVGQYTASITLTGKDGTSATITIAFEIRRGLLDKSDFELKLPDNAVYDGKTN